MTLFETHKFHREQHHLRLDWILYVQRTFALVEYAPEISKQKHALAALFSVQTQYWPCNEKTVCELLIACFLPYKT